MEIFHYWVTVNQSNCGVKVKIKWIRVSVMQDKAENALLVVKLNKMLMPVSFKINYYPNLKPRENIGIGIKSHNNVTFMFPFLSPLFYLHYTINYIPNLVI